MYGSGQDSIQYAKYQNELDAFADLDGDHGLSSADQDLVEGCLRADGTYNGMNKFKDEHQETIRTLLDKQFPFMGPEAKKYIVERRFVEVPGTLYSSDNPISDENRILAQKVHDIFELSGMNDFLKNISNEQAR